MTEKIQVRATKIVYFVPRTEQVLSSRRSWTQKRSTACFELTQFFTKVRMKFVNVLQD